jgi:alkanesulfonate monooxygenase SsuD/methylene tetrahydromethanopterin reductase-like flavin-dependent oxidoreductase (luciferase family)
VVTFGCDIIKFGYDIDKIFVYAKMAEKEGFDIVCLPDHLFHPLDQRFFPDPSWDTFIMLTAVGLNTNHVKLAPAVTDPFRRHPATLANEIATLDRLTNGRAFLTIGAGEALNMAYLDDPRWKKPVSALSEAVKVIKSLWLSTLDNPVNFDGEFFRLKNAFLGFKPVQKPHPPIYIGGYGPKIRQLVGELGDGWIPWIEAPESYKKKLDDIRRNATKAGRKAEEVDPAVMLYTVVLSNGNLAKEVAARRAKIALSLRTELLQELGYNDFAKESLPMWKTSFEKDEINKIYALADKLPMGLVEETTIAGTPDEAIEKIHKFIEAGARTFIVIPIIERFEETVKAYGEKIIPYFKETMS